MNDEERQEWEEEDLEEARYLHEMELEQKRGFGN